MKKFETIWQVIQEIAIVQEGGCSFDDEKLLHELIQNKREEFPDCLIKVYHKYWTTTYCSLLYEKHINSFYESENEEFNIKPKGDC